jgi:hypothetical protein
MCSRALLHDDNDTFRSRLGALGESAGTTKIRNRSLAGYPGITGASQRGASAHVKVFLVVLLLVASSKGI